MDVDEYMELDQYYEEKCARLELLNAQMLEVLEMAIKTLPDDQKMHHKHNACIKPNCAWCSVYAAIAAAKGEV